MRGLPCSAGGGGHCAMTDSGVERVQHPHQCRSNIVITVRALPFTALHLPPRPRNHPSRPFPRRLDFQSRTSLGVLGEVRQALVLPAAPAAAPALPPAAAPAPPPADPPHLPPRTYRLAAGALGPLQQ